MALAALLTTGCQYDPYTWTFTRREPKAADLVGRYVPTDETVAMLTNRMHYTHATTWIDLKQDGRFDAHAIPDCWMNSFGAPSNQFDHGQGNWHAEKHQDWWAVELEFDNALGITGVRDWTILITEADGSVTSKSGKASGFVTYAMLVGQRAPYTLHLTVGDPDSGIALQYRKENGPNRRLE
jgi:hypothetical protein